MILAWSVGEMSAHVHVGAFLTSFLGSSVPPSVFPALVFVTVRFQRLIELHAILCTAARPLYVCRRCLSHCGVTGRLDLLGHWQQLGHNEARTRSHLHSPDTVHHIPRSILFPMAVPVAAHMGGLIHGQPAAVAPDVVVASVAAILSGSIFGDHCSPIRFYLTRLFCRPVSVRVLVLTRCFSATQRCLLQ